MQTHRTKWLAFVATLSLCAGLMTVYPHAAAVDDPPTEPVTNPSAVTELIQENWSDNYFDQLVINPGQETATADGDPVQLEETLELSSQEAAQVMDCAETAEAFFSETPYDTQVTDNGDVVITAPYQTMRIFLCADHLTDSYGATKVLHDERFGEFILQYSTQEATQAAYERLCAEYGPKNCFVDQVIYADQLCGTDAADCSSWGASLMGLDKLQVEAAQSEEHVTVAIIDTGIDTAHAVFQGRTISPKSCNLMENSDDITDQIGHGTHVAGIVADCTPPNMELLILRIYNDAGQSTAGVVSSALKTAVEDQADVINMSLGWPTEEPNTYTFLDKTIDAAYQANIPIFCAAGNFSTQNPDATTSYPACHEKTIATSWIDQDQTFNDTSFSGPFIDFCAPGTDIKSAWLNGSTYTMSGTSMACPHLSAAASYVKLQKPDATVTEVYDTLKDSSVDLGTPGRDDYFGWGYVDLSHYLEGAPEEPEPAVPVPSLSNMTLKLSQTSYTYNGKARKPAVTLLSNGKVVAAEHYKVSYQNNKQIGTATVTVTGIGGYEGSIKKKFTIKAGIASLYKLTNDANGIKITWKQVTAATGYRLYRQTGNGKWKTVKTIGKGTTLNWTDKKVTDCTMYRYRLRPLYGRIVGDYKNTKTFWRISAPVITRLRKQSATSLTVTWKKNTKLSGYRIQYAAAKNFRGYKAIEVKSAKTAQQVIKKLSKKKRYYVRMRAYKTINGNPTWSAWSATRAVDLK